MSANGRERGAALLLALLLLVLGSLHFLLVSADTRDAHREVTRASRQLDRVRQAIMGYALETGCLPCPAVTPADGTAPSTCTSTSSRYGFVPWRSLAIDATDPWGGYLRYRVSAAYAGSGCSFSQTTTGEVAIASRSETGSLRVIESEAPFVILSHGPNRLGAVLEDGTAAPPLPATHVDERTNRYDRDRFVTRPWRRDPGAAGGPFDDLLAWTDSSEICRLLARKQSWSCS